MQLNLSDATEIRQGYPFRNKIEETLGSSVFAVQMKDVSAQGDISWESAVETTIAGKRQPDWLVSGDILFSYRGNHNYAVLVDGIADTIKAVASPHFFVIRCKADDLIPGYVAWLLNQGPLQAYFEKERMGSLTKGLRKETIVNAPIVVPPIDKQRQIVELARTVTQEHRLLEKLIQNNEAMMGGIAAALFNGSK